MEGLQRSSTTFRRSGSSGLVWEDRFAPGGGAGGGEMDDPDKIKMGDNHEEGSVGRLRRSRSHGSNGGSTGGNNNNNNNTGYRAGRVVPPALDPPSPRVSVCGFCSFFKAPNAPPSSSKPPNARRHR